MDHDLAEVPAPSTHSLPSSSDHQAPITVHPNTFAALAAEAQTDADRLEADAEHMTPETPAPAVSPAAESSLLRRSERLRSRQPVSPTDETLIQSCTTPFQA